MSDPSSINLVQWPLQSELTILQDGQTKTSAAEGEPELALKKILHDLSKGSEINSLVSTRDILFMVFTLPSISHTELEGMLQIEAEEISPFSPEGTCMGWETLQQSDKQSRVLMALCSRKLLNPVQKKLTDLGMIPGRVDADVLAWLENLKQFGALPKDQDHLLLLLQAEDGILVAWHQNTPVLIRSLMDARHYSPETLEEELELAEVSLESNFANFVRPPLVVWFDGEAPTTWEADFQALDQLPPLSQGLLARGQRADSLNLAPPDWREAEAKKQARKKQLRLASSFIGAWILCMLGFMAWTSVQKSGVRKLEAANQARIQATTDVEELSDRVRSLNQFTDHSTSALETLRLLAEAAPGSGTLLIEDYRYQKDKGITVSGKVNGDAQPFYVFHEELTSNHLLKVPTYEVQEEKSGFSFRVEAMWEWIENEDEEGQP